MFRVITGTEKQIDYANDILRRPIYCVMGWIAQAEETVTMDYKRAKEDREHLTVLVPVLHDAISIYEEALCGAKEQLIARYVIDNYERNNMFWRLMYSCIGAAMKKAGIECANPALYMTTDKRYWPKKS